MEVEIVGGIRRGERDRSIGFGSGRNARRGLGRNTKRGLRYLVGGRPCLGAKLHSTKKFYKLDDHNLNCPVSHSVKCHIVSHSVT